MRKTQNTITGMINCEFWWAMHNLVSHPLSQIIWWISLFGFFKSIALFGDWVHDCTVPDHKEGEGHG